VPLVKKLSRRVENAVESVEKRSEKQAQNLN